MMQQQHNLFDSQIFTLVFRIKKFVSEINSILISCKNV